MKGAGCVITRSTHSCGPAREGNQTCEAARSHWTFSVRRRGDTPDGEGASPNESEPCRPRYAKGVVATLPEVVKPEIAREATSMSVRTTRGGWGRARAERSARHPGRSGEAVVRCSSTKRGQGIHNLRRLCCHGYGRKSDGLVVAEKRGNARGAKGPDFSRVSVVRRKPA